MAGRRWVEAARRELGSRGVRPGVAVYALIVVLGSVTALLVLLLQPTQVELNSRPMDLTQDHATVGSVLAQSHIQLRSGVIYSAATHEPLPGVHAPPYLAVNGRPAHLDSPVGPGDRIFVTPRHMTEPVVARNVTSGIPGTPDIEYHLWHPGVPANERVASGIYSKELLSTSVVSPARAATPETNKVVALTFDDGPSPQWTPAVLQVLASEGVPATFCIVGYYAEHYPALVRAEVAQREALCDHTADHDEHLDKAPLGHIKDEVNRGATMIEQAAGEPVSFYRPPGGVLTPVIISVAHAEKLRILYWTIDSDDYRKPPAPTIMTNVLSRVRPGAIILFHDGGGDRSRTVAALKGIIDQLKSQGYGFVTPAGEAPAPAPVGSPIPQSPMPSGGE